jgi:hypothetical protein
MTSLGRHGPGSLFVNWKATPHRLIGLESFGGDGMFRGTSAYDVEHGTDWRKWYSAAEYFNPWDTVHRTGDAAPLDFAKQYDYMTQHVLSLLQTFHQFHANSVTTELCNVLLHKLLELLPSSTTTSKDKTKDETQDETVSKSNRVAARAYAIVQSMEWIERESALQHHSHHNVTARIPRAIPKPNRETYNTVLLIYSRTAGSYAIPRTAQAIVEKMEQRYTQQHELDMKVTNFHWNSVLLAWSLCTEPNSCVFATQLLLRNAARTDGDIVDASSYIHVLRMCARHGQSRQADNAQQWAILGANVAVQLWQEMFERDPNRRIEEGGGGTDMSPLSRQRRSLLTEPLTEEELRKPLYIPELPPHFYSHFLQAIRALPKNPPGSLREQYFTKCMERAVQEGMVNPYVLQEFFVHAQSPTVWDRFLGPYRTQIYGMSAKDAVATLMELIPPEWSARVSLVSYSRPPSEGGGS